MARPHSVFVSSLAVLVAAVAAPWACKSNTIETCQAGQEGCACADGQCLGGWPCIDNVCQRPTETSTGLPSTTTGPQPPATDTGEAVGEPMVSSFFTDSQTLSPDAPILFTAIVTHPGGLDEIVGGTLETTATASTYAAFNETAGGTFTVSLTWDMVNAVSLLTGPRDGDLTFDAVFFDNEGNSASASVDLMLECNGIDMCSGQCVDWSSDPLNCGGCEAPCGPDALCSSGECNVPALSPCFYPEDMTCAEACADLGQICVENGCNGGTYAWYISVDACIAKTFPDSSPSACDEPYAPGDTGGSSFITMDEPAVRCCCA